MKKHLFILAIILLGFSVSKAQCVPNCSAYTVNATTYSLFPTNGVNIVSSLSPNMDDGYAPPVPIGFSFNYYCTTYTDVSICSNGFILFGTPPTITSADAAQTFPSSTNPNGIIALNMCDLDAGAGGSITYTTIGTTPNQKFIVTYSNVPYWYSSPPSATLTCSGQIVLNETSNIIEIHTATVGIQSYISSQGIENQNGSAGVNVPNRTATFWSASNSAYQFTNLIQGTPPTSIGGSSLVCFGALANYTCSSMNGASSYSWSLPGGWNGSSTTTALTATSGIAGTVSVTATYTCGTSSAAQFTVSVIPAPIISVTSVSPNVLCSGSIVTINASGGLNYTLMPGNLSVVPPFTIMPMTNLTYSVYGDDTNGCLSVNPGLAPVNVNATPTVVVNSGSVCVGQQFTITPTGATSYSYSSLFNQVTPTVSGTYSYMVWGIGGNGCVGNAISTVTAHALPTLIASSTRTTMCIKESVTLTAVGASSINWVSGAANTATLLVNPTFPNTAQIFSVTGTNSLGCSNSTTIALKINACTGINEVKIDANKLSVYPNPSRNYFHVESENELNGPYYIYNLTGALIETKIIQGHQIDLHLENYASGIYYLKLNQSTEVYKLVKID